MHNAIFFTCLVHYRHPAEVVRVFHHADAPTRPGPRVRAGGPSDG